MDKTRQVKRLEERLSKKNSIVTAILKYIPFIRKSRAGIEYTHYKKVIEKI